MGMSVACTSTAILYVWGLSTSIAYSCVYMCAQKVAIIIICTGTSYAQK